MTIPSLSAIQTGLEVAAHNVANSVTPGFEPSRVVFQAGPAGQVRPHVDHPRHRLDEEGISDAETDPAQPSETDVAKELTDVTVLQRTYTANLKSLYAQHQSLGLLVDTLI
jgi:flagellar hook protein FlgE